MKHLYLIISLLLFSALPLTAQVQKTPSSTEIYHKIEKLNFLGTALYVAAHPDDENTGVISYLSNEVKARVGYISLTRGDGGQNLIGTEIRELLGVIRTEELLEARKIDGGVQFFSRANDFGYSKHPDETFDIWNKEEVLSDLVYVIRKFKPDVIINRFDHRSPGTTHGHHTGSAMLSVEAFDKANDAKYFPEHLDRTTLWQPKRAFFNTNWWFFGSQERFDKIDKSKYFQVDIGGYYPSLGLSNTEISALSRSQHSSQGFGTDGKRGSDVNFLEPVKGDFDLKNDKSLFAGINTTWTRVKGGEAIGKILEEVQKDFDFTNPANSLPKLIEAHRLISELEDDHWKLVKKAEIEEIILACTGVFIQATTKEQFVTKGEKIELAIEAINRSNTKVVLKNYSIISGEHQKSVDKSLTLEYNIKMLDKTDYTIAHNAKYSSPYWLEEEGTIGMYKVSDKNLTAAPKAMPRTMFVYTLEIEGVDFMFSQEVKHKTVSPSDGEIIKPLAIVPEVSVAMNDKTLVFADNEAKEVLLTVKTYKDGLKGEVSLQEIMKEGKWEVEPASIPIELASKGMSQTVRFTIRPKVNQAESVLEAVFTFDGKDYKDEVHVIDYPHINQQTAVLPTTLNVNRIDIQKKGENIGFIIGAGDEVPASLRAIGYTVTEIYPNQITDELLASFDAVVLGIRAYDLDNDLPLYQDKLFEYVKKGGVLVTQYNSLRELRTKTLAPYEMVLSHDRVTDENSPVKFLEKKHPVLNTPNKITMADFDGWVQERGLYFPSKWGKEFTPILGMNDKGEKMLKSSLLIAEYGEGYYIYTGLSFFRELPAGVSGAYRLFANILSLGK